MKKSFFAVIAMSFLILAGAVAPPVAAQNKGGFTITTSALGAYILNISNTETDYTIGGGGYLMADYQPIDWMTIGLGGGYTAFFKGGDFIGLESVDVVGRLLPPPALAEKMGNITPYLIGGVGYRPVVNDDLQNFWPGHYHAMAGAGMRLDFTGNRPGSGLDIAVVINGYSPKEFIMKTADLRVGYSFAIGGGERVPKPKSTASSMMMQATPAITPMSDSATAITQTAASTVKTTAETAKTTMAEAKTEAAGAVQKVIEEPTATPVVIKPAVAAKPAAAKPAAATSAPWWDEPFSADAAFTKLTEEKIPADVKAHNLEAVGKDAKPFFDKLYVSGVRGKAYLNYRARYLTAVASALYDNKDKSRAKYYVEQALKVDPALKEALDLQAKIGQ